jgi:tRNA pseudouridine55 synthase
MSSEPLKPHPHGWLILDKPRGLGSTQAVAAVKRALRRAGYGKVKIGHGGTLDPLAEGVLPIALGEATKLAGRMLDASKTYAFTIAFGEETDTLDKEGEVIAASDRRPPLAAVAAILEHFTGAIEQIPPAYSALKVAGKRAYDLARAGEAVELPSRRVTIHLLALQHSGAHPALESAFADTVTGFDPIIPEAPLELADSVTMLANVSKGTYIR